MKKKVQCLFILWVCAGWALMAHAENRWAVVIGISNYQNSRANLRYSTSDATAIYHILSRNGFFPRDHMSLLLDEEATHQNITQVLSEWLPSRAEPGDTVVVYYSGHGIYSHDLPPHDEADGRDEYLAPYDIDFSSFTRICETGIRDDFIAERLGTLPSNTIVIFDSCYSGGGIRSSMVSARPKSLIPFVPQQLRDMSAATGDMLGEFADIPDRITFIAASLPGQQSWEDEELQQSIFTYYFLQGLDGAADRNHDGDISVVEAFHFAQQGIASNPKWKSLQQPVLEIGKDCVLVSQLATAHDSTISRERASEQRWEKRGGPASGSLPRVPDSSFRRKGPIKIDVWFERIQANGTIQPALEEQEYHSGEMLRLSFQADHNCYIMLFNIDCMGKVNVLYPTYQSDESIFIEKGQSYRVRGKFNMEAGVERFYAVASEHIFRLSRDILPHIRPNRNNPPNQQPTALSPVPSLSYATIQLQHR